MRLYLLSLLTVSAPVNLVSAANAFAGSNLYYAAGLRADTRTTLLNGLQSADMKVLRVWLDGQSTSQKATPIDPFPDLEPTEICNGDTSCYDDTVLERLDDFMIDAHARGIKLIITMHSFNALQAGDVYGREFGTGFFYEQDFPQQAFDKRLVHILNHVHATLGKPWKELSDYIFGFEAENEAMIGKTWANAITGAGLAWLYWQVLPNADPHQGFDYEIGIGDPSWSTLQGVAQTALNAPGAFDFSEFLL